MTRQECETFLAKKGLKLQKCGNLYQVRDKSLMSIYQSHDFDDICRHISSLSGFYTQGGEFGKETSNKACMVAYSRTTRRP